uniref:D-glycero-beta-D-manno-heptose 1-phosphate adenylyltransferase n=1 Tax=Chlorobium chlorochromatii (strain CaD3) TaxID=340177 RepID=Q3AQ56_CHLCH
MAAISPKILSWQNAAEQVQAWRAMGNKVVFTNGCFDILHAGHVHYLQAAKSLGQRLCIGLNSDASVQRLKGPKRPICNEVDRATLLAALEVVDMVVLFDEDTPERLIAALLPNVLVKGADWAVEQIAGAATVLQHGGEVLTVPLLDGRSTTGVIERIIERYSL